MRSINYIRGTAYPPDLALLSCPGGLPGAALLYMPDKRGFKALGTIRRTLWEEWCPL